jgi:hypothetical protein
MAVLLHHGYSLTISPVKPSREKNGSEETAVSENLKDSGKNPKTSVHPRVEMPKNTSVPGHQPIPPEC